MAFNIYVSGYKPETTLEDLIIYFQSKESGGGDIEEDKCQFDEKETVIAFDDEADQQRVLNREHEEFKVSQKSSKQKKDSKSQPLVKKDDKKPTVGEVKTVIVSGISPQTKDDTLKNLFENTRRSGGGDIKHIERVQPEIAHVTFFSSEVAKSVLEKAGNLEVDGYLLKLKSKKPDVIFPIDKKKLFIENIDPKTSKDSLTNYVEIITKKDVVNVVMGNKNDAMVTLSGEQEDINKVTEKVKKKQLEGVLVKITHPPVCNSILITGISENTTKDSLELRFENSRYGGGDILDVIFQQNKGKAIISFLDPNVIDSITSKDQTLNDSSLTIRPCYPFMEDNVVDEEKREEKIIQVKSDIMNHVSNRCDEEFLELFSFSTSELKYDEVKEEVTIFNKKEIDKIEDYFNQFEVSEISVSKSFKKNEVQEIVAAATKENDKNMTYVEFDEDKHCILVTGKKKKVKKSENVIEKKLEEFEKMKEVVTTSISLDQNKLMLFYALGFEEQFDSQPNIDVKIKPQEGALELKGSKELVNEAQLKALEECNKIKEDYIELNKRQERFLTSGGLNNINTYLKNKGIKALVCLDESKQGKAKIVFVDSEKFDKIEAFISEKIFEKCCTLEDESEQLLQSEKWIEMENKLSNEFGIQVSVSPNEEVNVWLTGEKIKVQQAHDLLKKFVKTNTIVNESIAFDEGINRYLTKHCHNKIIGIEGTQKEQMVKINTNEDGTITLQGTKDGAKEATKKLQNIVDKLEHCTITIEQPGMQKYFKSEAGKSSLRGIESELQCSINVTNNKEENRSMEIRSNLNQPSSIPTSVTQLLCTYETPEKISLKVYQDDITNHKCDVIVNAANGDLRHIGGLAWAIVNKGGKEIQEDCDQFTRKKGSLLPGQIYKGIPGKLPCKKIIHMVGPRWENHNRVKHENHLKYACEKTLESSKNDKTIALPAVGSGIYGVPKDVCARVMVEAALKFSSSDGKKSSLQEIHFVNNDKPTAQAFLSEFKKRFSDKPKYAERGFTPPYRKMKQDDGRRRRTADNEEMTSSDVSEVPRRPLNADSIVTKTQTISVIIGDLATHKADVLVNTTSQNLDLNSNPCGRALSNEAGPQLQRECNKLGRLKVGEVALTPGGNLLCKQVCHVVCAQYNNGQGEQVLSTIIRSCLKESDSRGHTSIAFPAIGTGILGFPHKITAKICFEEVKQFAKKNPKTSLKDVHFVVYHQDQESSIKAFKDELRNQPEWKQASSGGGHTGPSRRDLRKPVESEEQQTTTTTTTTPIVNDEKDGGISVSLKDGGKIHVLDGDITEEKTDVIAHLSNPDGSMNGGVAQAIIKNGGQKIGKQRAGKINVRMYETVLTKAGRLPAKCIAHMAGPDGPDCNDIKKCITKCLEEVTNNKYKSISFPAIGTGQLGMAPEKSAEAMLTAIVEFLQSNPGSINTVRIIIHDQEVFIRFSKAVKTFLSDQDNQSPGIFRSFINGIWNYFKSDSAAAMADNETTPIIQPLFLKVYTEKQRTIEKVKEKIVTISREQMKKETVENDQIKNLSKVQETKIIDIGRKRNVEVKIEKPIDRIIVSGHSEDVSTVLSEVNSILNELKMAEHEKETAEIVSQNVKWCWLDNEDEVEFDKTINSQIEKAHAKNEKSVSFTLKEGKCKIDFDQMIERNLNTGQKTKVSRKESKGSVSVPDYWDSQPKDASGKELSVHVVLLDPTNDANHQKEYKKVSDGFKLTVPSQTIKSIQRIQNPTLYRLYAIKKLSMDERNGSKEKILYHGTATTNVPDINQNGLNRSYKGVNGTAHGHGIYFATNASMSVGYARPDVSGNRTMYVARVAVGQYDKSSSGMLVPPPLPGSQNDKYDSVVDNVQNPTIFVMFYDNQYYPEYLITFQ